MLSGTLVNTSSPAAICTWRMIGSACAASCPAIGCPARAQPSTPPSNIKALSPGTRASNRRLLALVRRPVWQVKIRLLSMPQASGPLSGKLSGSESEPGIWREANSSAWRTSTSSAWPASTSDAASEGDKIFSMMGLRKFGRFR